MIMKHNINHKCKDYIETLKSIKYIYHNNELIKIKNIEIKNGAPKYEGELLYVNILFNNKYKYNVKVENFNILYGVEMYSLRTNSLPFYTNVYDFIKDLKNHKTKIYEDLDINKKRVEKCTKQIEKFGKYNQKYLDMFPEFII